MKARGRRPSAFIVFKCMETPMKHEARVFEKTSQSKLKLRSRKRNKIVHYRPVPVPHISSQKSAVNFIWFNEF